MAILGSENSQIVHLIGTAILQTAMAELGSAKNKSKSSQFIAIYLIK